MQVGISKIKDQNTGKNRVLKYSDVPTKSGWVFPKDYLPISFDLMFLDVGRKVLSGWWDGHNWEGLHIKKTDVVSKWKRNLSHYD